MKKNFVEQILEVGGSIHPLLVPSDYLKGPGLTNPSVYVDHDGRVLVNLRNISYTLYHAEKRKYEHHWGPLVYIHPENDCYLRTNNIMLEINPYTMDVKTFCRIDTSAFPDKQLWEFVGLEDARIARWNGKLYISGVRRDLDEIGTGRMELSELEIVGDTVKEISQHRIPAPGPNDSYCEKNWMPIKDLPYHYVKWTNSTEVVKYDIENEITKTVSLTDWQDFGCIDLRGGSQVLRWGDGYIALVHETFLTWSDNNRKDGVYRHRFVIWNKDWKLVKVSKQFSFLEGSIEFGVGMDYLGDDVLITFGFQDNAAYILKFPKTFLEAFLEE
jgi:hypothetical protein